MKIKDILEAVSGHTYDASLYHLRYVLDEEYTEGYSDEAEKNIVTRISFKSHAFHYFDPESCVDIFSVWFDDKPVLLTGIAGKDCDALEFILDGKLYTAMINWIASHKEPKKDPGSVSLDTDIDDVFYYGQYLNEWF